MIPIIVEREISPGVWALDVEWPEGEPCPYTWEPLRLAPPAPSFPPWSTTNEGFRSLSREIWRSFWRDES